MGRSVTSEPAGDRLTSMFGEIAIAVGTLLIVILILVLKPFERHDPYHDPSQCDICNGYHESGTWK